MGVLVPSPPVRSRVILSSAWVRDADGHLHYLRPWPWLCLHCHTVQPAERTDCRNCGAPKPAPEIQS